MISSAPETTNRWSVGLHRMRTYYWLRKQGRKLRSDFAKGKALSMCIRDYSAEFTIWPMENRVSTGGGPLFGAWNYTALVLQGLRLVVSSVLFVRISTAGFLLVWIYSR